jgi:hypothetical protein
MATDYLYDWDVETLLPLQDQALKSFAIKSWTRALLEQSQMKPEKFLYAHFYDVESKKTTESFKRWHREGYPDPKFFSKNGAPGKPLIFEEKYPGTLHTLLHPGWVMLSGPTTIQSCRLLLEKLEHSISFIISHRFHLEAPGSAMPPSNPLMHLFGDFYTDSYIAWLKKEGTFEKFIAALGLSIEKFLHQAEDFTNAPIFQFDPNEWFFCNSLGATDIAMLVKRIQDLDKAYKKPVVTDTESDALRILRTHLKRDLDSENLQYLEYWLTLTLEKYDLEKVLASIKRRI